MESSYTWTWPTWKTISIGGVPATKLLRKLEGENFIVEEEVKKMITEATFTMLPQPTRLNLVLTSVFELTLIAGGPIKENSPFGPTYSEILAYLKQFDCKPCPAETAAHLRLQWTDQTIDEFCVVVTEPFIGPDNSVRIFDLDGRSLCAGSIGDVNLGKWPLERKLVFAKNK